MAQTPRQLAEMIANFRIPPDYPSTRANLANDIETALTSAVAAHEAALAESGFVIVPREPTGAMATAGHEANDSAWDGPCPHDAMNVWHAMIRARPNAR